MKRLRIATAFALALVIAGQTPSVSAADPDASNAPRTTGPLVGPSIPCQDNGPAGPGEARGQTCGYLYSLLPAESDADEDFDAYWLQMEIDPGKGWCAKELRFDLDAPGDGRIVSASPAKSSKVKRPFAGIARLVVDAGGAAPVPGTIEQDVMIQPGSIDVSVSEEHYRYRWRGNSKDKIVVAVGIQFAKSSLPPQLSYDWHEVEGGGMGSCRPFVAEIASH